MAKKLAALIAIDTICGIGDPIAPGTRFSPENAEQRASLISSGAAREISEAELEADKAAKAESERKADAERKADEAKAKAEAEAKAKAADAKAKSDGLEKSLAYAAEQIHKGSMELAYAVSGISREYDQRPEDVEKTLQARVDALGPRQAELGEDTGKGGGDDSIRGAGSDSIPGAAGDDTGSGAQSAE